jgi:hypothetical protein
MMSMAFVEQPESVSTRHHQTVNRTRATAALPSVIGGLGSDFIRFRIERRMCVSTSGSGPLYQLWRRPPQPEELPCQAPETPDRLDFYLYPFGVQPGMDILGPGVGGLARRPDDSIRLHFRAARGLHGNLISRPIYSPERVISHSGSGDGVNGRPVAFWRVLLGAARNASSAARARGPAPV